MIIEELENSYDATDKYTVTMPARKLWSICIQMDTDDPDAEDDELVSFVVWNTQVAPLTPDIMHDALRIARIVDISTTPKSSTGMSEYTMFVPYRRRRSRSYTGKRWRSLRRSLASRHNYEY